MRTPLFWKLRSSRDPSPLDPNRNRQQSLAQGSLREVSMIEPLDAVGNEDSMVDLRCSVLVAHQNQVLLIRRRAARLPDAPADDWVLPGGYPREREGLAACARREVAEETGLRINPERCAFVAEVIAPGGRRTVELTFVVALPGAHPPPVTGEPGTEPVWVSLNDVRSLRLHPPIAGFLPSVLHRNAHTAPFLGNLWRGAGQNDEQEG